jgi:hypothetical protein
MASSAGIRLRRSAAQRHALVTLERQIRATDPNSRRKYLRDFNEAFRQYEKVLAADELDALLRSADIVLLGDYHALAASQLSAASLVEKIAQNGRPVVLGLEMVFARDQHILDEWQRAEISEGELRERIRFDSDWGYEWAPYAELLRRARGAGAQVYGLDCMPRGDMRRIGARDRHAAHKLAEIRNWHPDAVILVLMGESHLAPNHLPAMLRKALPEQRVLTLLQNIDSLYWRAAGEACDHVQAVHVCSAPQQNIACIFTSTPLEKYESYRLCLERWTKERAEAPDFATSVYNLVEGLARALNIDQYSPHNTTQPRFLVDSLPEVHAGLTAEMRRRLARKGAAAAEIALIVERVEEDGVCYAPHVNAMLVSRWDMKVGAEQVTRFVHSACRGALKSGDRPAAETAPSGEITPEQEEELAADRFYAAVLEVAIADVGARILHPARSPLREAHLIAVYAMQREEIEQQSIFSYREYMEMIDFLMFHRDYDAHPRKYWETPELIARGRRFPAAKFEFVTTRLGQLLGTELYDAYLAGRVNKRFLRSLFFRKIEKPGIARSTYFAAVSAARKSAR